MNQPQLPSGPRRPSRKSLSWVDTPGVKMLAVLVALLLVLLGGIAIYDNFFAKEKPTPSSTWLDQQKPENVLSSKPAEVVRKLYQHLAQPRTDLACAFFDKAAAQQFATNFGAPDCQTLLGRLTTQVTNATDYAASIRPSQLQVPTGNTTQISSCAFNVKGGPSLGLFTLTKVELGLWRITAHALEPNPCPNAPTS